MGSGRQSIPALLGPRDGPPVEVINANGGGPMVLVCEHASNFIPASLNGLGLPGEAKDSHIAWDPGALAVARILSEAFDAPLVAGRVSRLVYDCNRSPDRPDAVPVRSERNDIPGNAELSAAERGQRVSEIYEPFANMLAWVIDGKTSSHPPPALVTIHSFTRVYLDQVRDVELGILHDSDARLADAMLQRGAEITGLRTARNDPYGPQDGVAHTLQVHGIARGLPNVMIEIRNDLIADGSAQKQVAENLSRLLRESLAALPAVDTAGAA
ncbi:MAG: N-formylglutamate amidohydrolase [Pseudomonadota bacterium]